MTINSHSERGEESHKLIPAPCGRGSKGEGVKFEHLDNDTIVPPLNPRIDSFPRPWWERGRERGRERGQKAAFTLAEV
ncbi:MAG: hypothetical protein NC191_09095, partial [Muribaculaceae bacterium]|nr:hypothetical protein [Muribaculaceae bacterium]